METILEFCDSRGSTLRVDRNNGVIRGVKVLGLESRNGRTYLPEALTQAARLYEGAKVNVNHPKGNPSGPRDYQDRIGMIRNVTMLSGAGLFGDFHFNPKHALAEQLMWDAEHAPENVGFSHNVEAKVGRRGDRVTVEAITRVQSVDLVADPATTRGLFEATDPLAAKRQLVEAVATEVGLPHYCIPPLDGGLAYREGRDEIANYLRWILEGLVAKGYKPTPKLAAVDRFAVGDDAESAEDFCRAATGRFSTAEADQFREDMGLPSRNGRGKLFAKGITE